MQVEANHEWDFIQNSISDLTNKLEHLPNDLKYKAVQLLQEKLATDDVTTLTRLSTKKKKQLPKKNIKDSKKFLDIIKKEKPDCDENMFVLAIQEPTPYYDDDPYIETIKCEIENDVMDDSKDINCSELLCETCAFIGGNARELNKHKRLEHGIILERICHTCGKVLPNFRQLQSHLAAHSQETELMKVHYQEDQKFECELCGAKLRSKSIYIEHIGRHFNRQRKTCDLCGKLFPNSSQLNAHKLNHEPPKVPCFICDKKFRNKHKLSTHLLIHSGQRDFACPECPYTTYVKHNLLKHCLKKHNLNYPPVRQSIKRFHPDEVETSRLSDPLARSHIDKIRGSGECFPTNINDGIKIIQQHGNVAAKKVKKEIDLQLSKKYHPSELLISNEVEVSAAEGRKKKLGKKNKMIKAPGEKSGKNYYVKKKCKYPSVRRQKYPSVARRMVDVYDGNFSHIDEESDGGNMQINVETDIDCVEETIY